MQRLTAQRNQPKNRTARKQAIGIVLMVGLLLVSCDTEPKRSIQAFCSTYESESIRLYSKYRSQTKGFNPETNPIGSLAAGLGSLLEAQGDLIVLMDRLEPVAPSDIQPEIAAVRDAFRQQAESSRGMAGSPLGALASSVMSSLQSQGSYRRVEEYIGANCDVVAIKRRAAQVAQ